MDEPLWEPVLLRLSDIDRSIEARVRRLRFLIEHRDLFQS